MFSGMFFFGMYFVATCRMLLVNLSVYVSTSSWFPILSSGLSNSSLNLSLIALFCTWKTVLRCPFILWALCWSGLLLGSGRFLCHRILPIGCPQGLLPLLWSLLRCRLSVDLGLLVWLLRSWVWWIELCFVFYQFHEFSPPVPAVLVLDHHVGWRQLKYLIFIFVVFNLTLVLLCLLPKGFLEDRHNDDEDGTWLPCYFHTDIICVFGSECFLVNNMKFLVY